jgi:hypothetical protein
MSQKVNVLKMNLLHAAAKPVQVIQGMAKVDLHILNGCIYAFRDMSVGMH